MDEESAQFCSNCKKNVGVANFASHSAFCQRNITICEVCDEPVPRNSMKEHEEEYHISVICDMCKTSIKKWRLAKHQEMCPKRRVICQFCEADFAIDEVQEHNEFCGSRTEKCPFCSKYIMFKHKNKHMELHIYEENYLRGDGAGEVHQNAMNEVICETSEKISDEYTKCHLCREYILWNEYEQHMTKCSAKNDFRKCPHCDEYVPPFALKDHTYETCGMKKKLKTQVNKLESKAGGRSLSNYEKSESKTDCRSLSNYGMSESKTEYRSVGYGFSGDHTEDDLKLCPYCKQLLPQDTIYEHLKSCPVEYYECDLCLEKVLVKDRETHFNTQCKMILKEEISSDLYECPLCGETLLEKNKASHESFSCRTLLHNNEGPLYMLPEPDERTSRKYVPETANPTETCMNCKKKIPIFEVFSHKQSCNKTMTKQCVYCDKELHSDKQEENHLRNCEVYIQMVNVKDDERGFSHKGAKPKHSKFSDIVKPKVGKCTYCNTTLNDNILLFHEKECIYQEIRCPDCYSTVLLKDFDKHRCKSPKRKDKGRGSRKTQKDEKSESKSSWLPSFSLFGSNKSNVKPTLDEHQNDRNQFYETRMKTRYPSPGVKNDEDLYFAQQPIMEEPKIPCEFCDKLLPASEVVLHMTGCNPTEVSLPKPISTERLRENEASSRQLKRFYDSTTTSTERSRENESISRQIKHVYGSTTTSTERPRENEASSRQFKPVYGSSTTSENFRGTSAGRGTSIPFTKYESIHRRLEQSEATPGQYLNSGETSKPQMLHSDFQRISRENQSSFALKSVWNNDSSDVEMEEADPKPSSKTMDQNLQENVKEQSRKFLHESRKHTVDSDEEISSMINFIEGDTTESANLKEENDSITLDKHDRSEIHADEEYIISKTGVSHKEEGPFKNAYHYISNVAENTVPDKVTKETTVNPNFVHNKMKDSGDDNDELDYFTDKYQCKKNIHRTHSDSSQPETHDDKKKKQPAHNITETEFILDESKKRELSNFRFCGNKMKNSVNESEELQNSKKEEYDVYYKTNALGYTTVSEDEESKIRRPRKKDADAYQNKVLQLKHEYQDDSTAETTLDKRNENISSHMPEKEIEVVRSKYEYQDDNVIETSQEERIKSRTQYVAASMSEETIEMLRSKYQHQYIDDILASQKKEFESKTQDFSPPTSEKSREMLRAKYMYQDDHANEISQEIAKIRIQDVSSSIPEKPFEISRSKYKYQDYDEEDVGQHDRFKSKTRDISSAKPEISKEMSRSKFKYQDDNDEDVGQHERFKSKTHDVSSTKQEISKGISKLKYQDDEEEDIGQHERFKSKTHDVSSAKQEISKEMSKSKYMHQNVADIRFSELCERVKSRSQDALEAYKVLRSKYMHLDDGDDIQTSQKGKTKSRHDGDASSMLENSKEMLKSKYVHQDEEDDMQTSQKEKTKSRSDEASFSMQEKSKEQSKYHTACPMCRQTIRWIDYNTHIPACASNSGRCARCGLEVPSSDLKEHILVKCSQIRAKVESAKERNQQILRTSAHSYEQILQSNEKVGEKKSLLEMRDKRERVENVRVKTSASRDKIDCAESNKSSHASRARQAFQIEPAENYRNPPEANNRKVLSISENSRERHLKGTGESPNSFPSNDEDLEKWYKWKNKTSDENF